MTNLSSCAVAEISFILHLWSLATALIHEDQANYTENVIFFLPPARLSCSFFNAPINFTAAVEGGCLPSIVQNSSIQQSVSSTISSRSLKIPPALTSYLHGREVSHMVELKDHLHVTSGEAPVVPPYIVIARPKVVAVAVEKVVQTPGAIGQLAEPFRQPWGRIYGWAEDRNRVFLRFAHVHIFKMHKCCFSSKKVC